MINQVQYQLQDVFQKIHFHEIYFLNVRYSQKEQPATAEMQGDRLKVIFDEPQRAIASGQAVVLYDGDDVIGGGKIIREEQIMDTNTKAVIMKRLERTAENLRKNNMDAFVCETKEDAR